MRKCHLCGSVIRRKTEFCRFCSARQAGAQAENPDRAPLGPPPGSPSWTQLAPPESAIATKTAPEVPSPASFEPVWEVTERRRPEASPTLGLEATPTSAPRETEPDPWVFDEPVRSANAAVVRAEHPMLYPSTVTSAPKDPTPEEPDPVEAEAVVAPPAAPANGKKTRTASNGTNGTNGTNGSNGNGKNGNGKNGQHGNNETTTGTPFDLLRRPNGANANSAAARNGRNGSSHETKTSPPVPVASPPAAQPTTSPTIDREHLAGFEDFPDAIAPPEIRWG